LLDFFWGKASIDWDSQQKQSNSFEWLLRIVENSWSSTDYKTSIKLIYCNCKEKEILVDKKFDEKEKQIKVYQRKGTVCWGS